MYMDQMNKEEQAFKDEIQEMKRKIVKLNN